MEHAINFLQPLATKEALTALGLLTACYIGWKITQKGFSVVGGFASKASYAGLVASLLGLLGAGTMGVGVGEIASRWKLPDNSQMEPGFHKEDLQQLVKSFNGHTNPELLKHVMDYAREREGLAPKMSDEMLRGLLEKTNEHNADVVAKIIDLYRSREERLSGFHNNGLSRNTAKMDLGPTIFTSYIDREHISTGFPQTEFANGDSIMNLPTAYGMLMLGIASCIGSIVTLRRKT
jgi:hypothetical protein